MDPMVIIAVLYALLSIVLIVGVIFLFFAIWEIYIIIRVKVPWVKTPTASLVEIISNISLPKNSVLYDLGCGDGRFLFLAEKYGYRAVGYELALYPYFKCLYKKLINKSNIKVIRKDFYKENLKEADAIFLFLTKNVMQRIGDKLNNDLKTNTIIISYGFKLPGWIIEKILDTEPSKTYFYKI